MLEAHATADRHSACKEPRLPGSSRRNGLRMARSLQQMNVLHISYIYTTYILVCTKISYVIKGLQGTLACTNCPQLAADDGHARRNQLIRVGRCKEVHPCQPGQELLQGSTRGEAASAGSFCCWLVRRAYTRSLGAVGRTGSVQQLRNVECDHMPKRQCAAFPQTSCTRPAYSCKTSCSNT